MATIIKYIDKEEHRYPTPGDYFLNDDGNTIINVTKFSNEDFSFLVAVHELIEEYLTRRQGIDEPMIKEFDVAFEEERSLGLHKSTDEPGMDKRSPYREQHKFATKIEKLICKEMGYSWKEYEEVFDD